MPDQTALFYTVVAGVAALIGLSKGGLGGILGSLATPLLALVVPADQAIGLLLPILIVADVFAVMLHWRRWNNRLVVLLIPGAVVGVTVGTLFITNAPGDLLRKGLGLIALLFALYKLFEKRILAGLQYNSRPWHGLLTGTAAGFSSALAHTGGPVVSIYLLLQKVTPAVFIATSALFFAVLNWIKVPYYIYADLLTRERLMQVLWVMPLIPLTVWFGRWLSRQIDAATYERIIVWLLALSGLLLLFT